jgi:hypothetical protein
LKFSKTNREDENPLLNLLRNPREEAQRARVTLVVTLVETLAVALAA